jgi:hypothetical protein
MLGATAIVIDAVVDRSAVAGDGRNDRADRFAIGDDRQPLGVGGDRGCGDAAQQQGDRRGLERHRSGFHSAQAAVVGRRCH